MAFSTVTSEQNIVIVPFSDLAVGDFFYDPTSKVCRKVNTSTFQAQDGTLTGSVAAATPVKPIDVNIVWSYAV